nr:Signal peptidase I [Pandoravirus belohorizontensis]
MRAQKYTEVPHTAETTQQSTEPARHTLSVTATAFWVVYPVVWTCVLCATVSWFLGCVVPLAAVTSGSMEPQTYRGDLLLVVGPDFGGKVRVGDIVLYRLPHRPDTPIVHRVVGSRRRRRSIVDVDDSNATAMRDHQSVKPAATPWYRTKGDNNGVDDAGLVLPSFPSGLVPHAALVGAPLFPMATGGLAVQQCRQCTLGDEGRR